MKIVFWSNTNAHSCVSSSLIAVAAYMAMSLDQENKERVSVIQTQYRYNNIDYPLLGEGVLADDFFGTGVDALLSASKSRDVTEEDAYNASISLFNDRMNFYRSTRIANKESFYSEMKQFRAVVSALNDYYVDVFVDLAAGDSDFSKSVLLDADVVVVMIPQNRYFVKETLKAVKELGLTHVVYCVGRYDVNASLNLRNLQSMFHELRGHLFCVPYDVDYGNSISNGKAMQFLQQNNIGSMSKTNPHYNLYENIKKGVQLIRKEVKH